MTLTLNECLIQKENNPVLINKHNDWFCIKRTVVRNFYLNVPLRSVENLEKELKVSNKGIPVAAWECSIKRRLPGCNYTKDIRTMVFVKGNQEENCSKNSSRQNHFKSRYTTIKK